MDIDFLQYDAFMSMLVIAALVSDYDFKTYIKEIVTFIKTDLVLF